MTELAPNEGSQPRVLALLEPTVVTPSWIKIETWRLKHKSSRSGRIRVIWKMNKNNLGHFFLSCKLISFGQILGTITQSNGLKTQSLLGLLFVSPHKWCAQSHRCTRLFKPKIKQFHPISIWKRHSPLPTLTLIQHA